MTVIIETALYPLGERGDHYLIATWHRSLGSHLVSTDIQRRSLITSEQEKAFQLITVVLLIPLWLAGLNCLVIVSHVISTEIMVARPQYCWKNG